jgi:hypothetical protein
LRIFRENESPLGRKGGEGVERDANVTGGLRHGIDVDGDEQIARDWYDESVESESVGELNIETRRRGSFLSRARRVQR